MALFCSAGLLHQGWDHVFRPGAQPEAQPQDPHPGRLEDSGLSGELSRIHSHGTGSCSSGDTAHGQTAYFFISAFRWHFGNNVLMCEACMPVVASFFGLHPFTPSFLSPFHPFPSPSPPPCLGCPSLYICYFPFSSSAPPISQERNRNVYAVRCFNRAVRHG